MSNTRRFLFALPANLLQIFLLGVVYLPNQRDDISGVGGNIEIWPIAVLDVANFSRFRPLRFALPSHVHDSSNCRLLRRGGLDSTCSRDREESTFLLKGRFVVLVPTLDSDVPFFILARHPVGSALFSAPLNHVREHDDYPDVLLLA